MEATIPALTGGHYFKENGKLFHLFHTPYPNSFHPLSLPYTNTIQFRLSDNLCVFYVTLYFMSRAALYFMSHCTLCHTVLYVTLYFMSHCTLCHTVLYFTLYFMSHCTLCHTALSVTLYFLSHCTLCHT